VPAWCSTRRSGSAGGYHEIQAPPARYRIVSRAEVSGVELPQFAPTPASWIEATVRAGASLRVPEWSESLAVRLGARSSSNASEPSLESGRGIGTPNVR
jgi:hypothetical protein